MPSENPFGNLVGKERAKEVVKKRYQIAKKAQSKTHADYDKWFRMFSGELVEANYVGISKLAIPKPFEKVIRGTALLTQAIKRIRVAPQEQSDQANADFNEKIIAYEDRVLGLARIRKQWIQSARIHGESFLKVVWDVAQEEPDKPFMGLSFTLCDPKSVYHNPDHTSDQPLRWAVHEIEVPYADIKKNKLYSKEDLQRVKDTCTLGGKPQKTYSSRIGASQSTETTDRTTLMANIKEYFGPYDAKGDGEEENYFITLANDEVVLSAIPNPYAEILADPIPIFPLPIFPVPHQAHAMGDIEAAKALFVELNDMRNQRMDTVTLNIDPPKIILKAAQVDEKDLIARRGWMIRSALPNGVQVIPPDMQGVVAALNEEKVIQGDIDRTLGTPSFGAQTPVAGDITTDTATGVNAILQAQDIVSNFVLEEVKAALTRVYRAVLAYNQAFLDRNFKILIIGENVPPESMEVSPEKIKGNMDIDVEVELVGNRIARRAEALQALQVGSKIPGTNMGKLWEDYIRTHDKYNVEEYYTPPQPPPPEPPKVSVSLSGDLTQLQSSQVYSQIPGVNPKFADPIMTQEGRQLMRGRLPEYEEDESKRFERGMEVEKMKSEKEKQKKKDND